MPKTPNERPTEALRGDEIIENKSARTTTERLVLLKDVFKKWIHRLGERDGGWRDACSGEKQY